MKGIHADFCKFMNTVDSVLLKHKRILFFKKNQKGDILLNG
jgi:hypothetical protein